jgi:hypothetical protein
VAGEGTLPHILTPALIREIFDIESVVRGAGANVTVDFSVL